MNQPTERRLWMRRGGILAVPVIAAAIIFGHPETSAAQTTTPTTTAAPTKAPTTTTPGATTGTKPAPSADGKGKGGPGKAGKDGGDATLSALSGSTLTLTTASGSTRTITVNDATIYVRAKTRIALTDLKTGDKLRIRETQAGSNIASVVEVGSAKVDGTISAINGSTLTVTTRDNSTRKVVIGGNATITRLDQTVAQSALVVGQTVNAEGTLASDGTLTASSIRIPVPEARGKVSAVNATTITISDPKGNKTTTITVSANTKYVRGGQSVSLSDVTAGTEIKAAGTRNSDGSITAEQVTIELPKTHGTVSAISGDKITLTDPKGNTIITTTSATKVEREVAPGLTPTTAALSDVKVGQRVDAEGTSNSDGSFTALTLRIHDR